MALTAAEALGIARPQTSLADGVTLQASTLLVHVSAQGTFNGKDAVPMVVQSHVRPAASAGVGLGARASET